MPNSAGTQYMKEGDALPTFQATLRDGSGAPVPLLATDIVIFKLHERGTPSSTPSIGGAATIVEPDIDVATDPNNPNLGVVQYVLSTLQAASVTRGVWEVEWTLHPVSGREVTFPDVGFDTVYVSRRLPQPA
jgi:hypothetical protein